MQLRWFTCLQSEQKAYEYEFFISIRQTEHSSSNFGRMTRTYVRGAHLERLLHDESQQKGIDECRVGFYAIFHEEVSPDQILLICMYNALCCAVLACSVVAVVAPRWPEEGFTCATPDFQRRFKAHGIKWDSKEKTLTKNGIKKSYKNEFNSPEAERTTHDKSRTSEILREHGILVPSWHEWDHNASEIDNITSTLRTASFPLVVKPRHGQQGHGVRTELESPYEVLQAVRELRGVPIHVEEQVHGNEYRVTTFKGDVIAVTRRTGPRVVGDGRNSIEQLVRLGRSGNLAKLHTVDYNYLRKNGYSRQSIPEQDEEVELTTVKNMSNGGHGTYVHLDTVHPDNMSLFKTIASTLGLHTSGIDIIMDDITSARSATNRCYTIEVNSRPGWEGSVRDPAPDVEKTSLVDRVLTSLFD